MNRRLVSALAAVATSIAVSPPAGAIDLPPGFADDEVIAGLESPATLRFSPDGRMFIGDRITGKLWVARLDLSTRLWVRNPTPFYTFDIPKDGGGNPERLRSSGLRDITFDPGFAGNRYLYAFYMKDGPRQNRVVRLRADAVDPDVAEPGSETLVIELPSNATTASGSHNGGALEFGADGKLYITTGDGWTGGDSVQSLDTFTGKLYRLDSDGTIPVDNPFVAETSGDYRAIYALGLRNPYSMSRHPVTGALYINETLGSSKADILAATARANYGWQGFGGIGDDTPEWADAGGAGGVLATGGAWYPSDGYFPPEWHGRYFVALWGANDVNPGRIDYIQSDADTTVGGFADAVGELDPVTLEMLKPVLTRIGPDGDLYYLLTTYESDSGAVHRVRWDCQTTELTAVGRLRGVLDGRGARFSWTADPRAPEYHLNAVTTKAALVPPGAHRAPVVGGLAAVGCDAIGSATTSCSDADALDDAAELLFYQVISACGPGGDAELAQQ